MDSNHRPLVLRRVFPIGIHLNRDLLLAAGALPAELNPQFSVLANPENDTELLFANATDFLFDAVRPLLISQLLLSCDSSLLNRLLLSDRPLG